MALHQFSSTATSVWLSQAGKPDEQARRQKLMEATLAGGALEHADQLALDDLIRQNGLPARQTKLEESWFTSARNQEVVRIALEELLTPESAHHLCQRIQLRQIHPGRVYAMLLKRLRRQLANLVLQSTSISDPTRLRTALLELKRKNKRAWNILQQCALGRRVNSKLLNFAENELANQVLKTFRPTESNDRVSNGPAWMAPLRDWRTGRQLMGLLSRPSSSVVPEPLLKPLADCLRQVLGLDPASTVSMVLEHSPHPGEFLRRVIAYAVCSRLRIPDFAAMPLEAARRRALYHGLTARGWFGPPFLILLAFIFTAFSFKLINAADARYRLQHLHSLTRITGYDLLQIVRASRATQETGQSTDEFLSEFSNPEPLCHIENIPVQETLKTAAEVQQVRSDLGNFVQSKLVDKNDPRIQNTITIWNTLPVEDRLAISEESDDSFSLYWYPNAGKYLSEKKAKESAPIYVAALELEVREIQPSGWMIRGGIEVVARPYLLEVSPDRSVKQRIQASQKNEITVMRRLETTFGYCPIAVFVTERQLSRRFLAEIITLAQQRQIRSIKEPEAIPKQEIERFFETSLLLMLGRPTAEVGHGWPHRQTMDEWTKWLRRINGGDLSGVIQFSTFHAFWSIVMACILHGCLIRFQRRDLDIPEAAFRRELGDPELADEFEQSAKMLRVYFSPAYLPLVMPNATRKETSNHGDEHREQHDQSEDHCRRGSDAVLEADNGEDSCRRDDAWYSQAAPYAIAATVFRLQTNSTSYSDAFSVVDSQCAHASEVQSTNLTLLRYLNWAIPSIGFLGTVFGISDALLGAGGVLSQNATEREHVIQTMSLSLGIAFDTTAVALVLGLITTALYNHVVRGYEQLVQGTRLALVRLLQRDQSIL